MTTWTPATVQAETWTSEAPTPRVFDPYVFDSDPVFDTGGSFWVSKTAPTTTWTDE